MSENDFEKALTRLSAIVSRLEKGDLPLEESLQLFEEGVKLSRYCSDRLEEAERRIKVLVKDKGGKTKEVPFEEADLEDQGGGK
jgi:exodeoxyribonuclease VII small subunit